MRMFHLVSQTTEEVWDVNASVGAVERIVVGCAEVKTMKTLLISFQSKTLTKQKAIRHSLCILIVATLSLL